MKSNSLIVIVAIVLLFTVVFALVVRFGFLEKDDAPVAEHAILKTPVEEDSIITDAAKDKFSTAGNLVVEFVERTTVEDEDSYETAYDRYIVSEVDLKNQTDSTRDYHEALSESSGDIGEGEKVSFREAFGISYEDKDGWELYENLITQIGFTGDINEAELDEETKDKTGQNLYVFSDDCDVTENLLYGEVYDEILDSKVLYQMSDDTVQMPEYFTAMVSYRFKEQIVTKSLYLSVSVESGEEV